MDVTGFSATAPALLYLPHPCSRALLRLYFTPIPTARRTEPSCYQIGNSKSGLWLGLFLQTNKPAVGEARQSGSSADVAEGALSAR